MIAFDGVDFAYPDGTRVLTGIDIEVPQGTTLALLGASGSGKTTLLHLLLGLLKPQAGRVLVDGTDIVPLSERKLRPVRERMGVVFQDGALFDSMTVGENVSFLMRETMVLSEAEIEARTLRQLEYVGLAHTMDLMPDEPTSGLDPITADTICDLVRKVSEEKGLTSVLVTHRLRDAFKVADRIALFKDGHVHFFGERDELFALEDPYVQRFLA